MNTERELLWRRFDSPDGFPIDVVAIETLGQCNRACAYCPVSVADKRVGRLPAEIIYRVFDELGEIGFAGKLTYHFYNEPMLDTRMLDFIRYSAAKVPRATRHLTSNGDLLDRDGVIELYETGATVVAISAHDQETFDKFSEIRASLQKGAKMQVRPYFRVGDGTRAARITNRAGAIDLSRYGAEEVIEASPEGCNRVELNIDYQGNVHPCCMDFANGYVIGNIAEKGLRQIWREALPQFREHFFGNYTREACRKCAGMA